MPTLLDLANQFHQHLKTVKAKTPLDPRVVWYPWASLAALRFLDQFLSSDTEALRRMIGSDPVLDLGCGDGDVAFFLESLGARVDAVDHAPTNYNALLGVRALKQALESSIGIHVADVDSRPNLPASFYGFTIMLGVLYHLKNPFLVLETLSRHSRYIFLSTRVAAVTPDRKLNFGSYPLAYLVDERELNQDATNYWIFSEESLKRLLQRTGWNITHYATSGNSAAADPVSPKGDVRAYILAESRMTSPFTGFHLQEGWHAPEHHGMEYGIWRWTQRRFSVTLDLATPLVSPTLRFVFHLPEPFLAEHPAVTIHATVNGARLPAATFSTAGEHEYTAVVPSLEPGALEIEFELDRTLGPSEKDQRELGILVDFSGASPLLLA